MKHINFLIFVVTSIILHLGVISYILYGVSFEKNSLKDENVITFEILPVSDTVNIKTKVKQTAPTVTNENAKKVEKANKPEPAVTTEKAVNAKNPSTTDLTPPKKPLTKKDELPKTSETAVKPKLQEKVIANEPVKQPSKTLITEQPKTVKKVKEQKKSKSLDEIEKMLTNLDKASEGKNPKSANYNRKKSDEITNSRGNDQYIDGEETITEGLLIKQQVSQAWHNINAQLYDPGNKIILYISYNPDATVKKVILKQSICPTIPAASCHALEQSAIRAVYSANPIRGLDPKRYDIWHEVEEFIFDPSE